MVGRPGREYKFIRWKLKDLIDCVDEAERRGDFLRDLYGAAEYVGVVLVETTDSCEAAQGARPLIPKKGILISPNYHCRSLGILQSPKTDNHGPPYYNYLPM